MKTPADDAPAHADILVAHLLFSLEPGGLENGVVNLSNGLDRDGFKTEIVCLERTGAFARRLRSDVDVTCMEKPEGVSVMTVLRLARWIRERRPDVIHTHNLGPLIYAHLARVLALSDIPVLHGEHGMIRGRERTRERLIFRGLLFRLSRLVHTVSGALRANLCELGFPPEKIVAVINGVDCDKFRPADDKQRVRSEIAMPTEAAIIGMVGRFIETKRHLMMLEAFEEIARRHPEARLLILGDGGGFRRNVLDAIEKHSNRERIHWFGHQDNPLPYYQSMDLLAMPSHSEGLSNALLEAMACGVPAIAHPCCGASEVIENGVNGTLKVMDEADDIVGIVSGLLDEPQSLLTLGDRARKTAEDSFSLESMVERYAELYREISGRA